MNFWACIHLAGVLFFPPAVNMLFMMLFVITILVMKPNVMVSFVCSGKTTPVNLSGTADPSKQCDPFQPFGGETVDPFQNKTGLGDPFSGKDPFASSSASSKDSTSGFADFGSVS